MRGEIPLVSGALERNLRFLNHFITKSDYRFADNQLVGGAHLDKAEVGFMRRLAKAQSLWWGSDFVYDAILGNNDINMLVVRFDWHLGNDLLFKSKSDFAGRNRQLGNESIVISFA
jgi:hypothetical protein